MKIAKCTEIEKDPFDNTLILFIVVNMVGNLSIFWMTGSLKKPDLILFLTLMTTIATYGVVCCYKVLGFRHRETMGLMGIVSYFQLTLRLATTLLFFKLV